MVAKFWHYTHLIGLYTLVHRRVRIKLDLHSLSFLVTAHLRGLGQPTFTPQRRNFKQSLAARRVPSCWILALLPS